MQHWLAGHKLKNRPYEILQVLGEGGFGITYKAKNLNLEVPVVIKTPNSKLQRDKNYSKYLESFDKEAKQIAKLGMNPHPHIVRVFDFFAEEDLPCIIMDYVPGESLYDLVQMNGALSEELALKYIRQIGSALGVCHQQGIIHRDVHPNNILIHGESGKAILIDFGISGTTQTSRSNRSGNQAFAPWEQLISFGEQSSKTPQVDIYTLAGSLYYLVTGDTPTPSLARKFNNDELLEPKQHNPKLSDRLNEAILKGLELQPEDRPQTVKAWLELLTPSFTSSSQLTSSVGIDDYIRLSNFLAAGKWKDAEKETATIMLKVANQEEKKYLDYDDIKNFPCDDLCVIDLLWTVYSGGKFGFSIQQRIWQELGGQIDCTTEWELEERLGGDVDNKNYCLTYDLNAPEGHLPRMYVFKQYLLGGGWNDENGCLWLDTLVKGHWWTCALVSRLKYCNPDTIALPFDIDLLIKPLRDRLNEGILKGLEVEPSDRPQTVEEWLERLKMSPSPTKLSQNTVVFGGRSVELKIYEFDTVKTNDRGEIIKREHHSARYFIEEIGNGITLEMVEIPGGTFMMGSPEAELRRYRNESPQHEVTVPSFYMEKYEVTQAQWKAAAAMPQIERELKPEPSNFKGEELPVEQVSWYDALEFCKRLSKATGKEYRLPSEAEWEYACRAGTTTPFHFGETVTTELVNYDGTDWEYEGKVYPGNYANGPKGEYRAKTTPVGSFPANAFGLYDLHGNVWEWCGDRYQESYTGAPRDGSAWVKENSSLYVVRGGSWNHYPQGCRSAYRYRYAPDLVDNNIGFRCIATRTL